MLIATIDSLVEQLAGDRYSFCALYELSCSRSIVLEGGYSNASFTEEDTETKKPSPPEAVGRAGVSTLISLTPKLCYCKLDDYSRLWKQHMV